MVTFKWDDKRAWEIAKEEGVVEGLLRKMLTFFHGILYSVSSSFISSIQFPIGNYSL